MVCITVFLQPVFTNVYFDNCGIIVSGCVVLKYHNSQHKQKAVLWRGFLFLVKPRTTLTFAGVVVGAFVCLFCGIIVCGFFKLTSARVISFKNLIFSPVNYSVLADGLIAGFFIGVKK